MTTTTTTTTTPRTAAPSTTIATAKPKETSTSASTAARVTRVAASTFFARTLLALDRSLGETVPRVLQNADEEAIHDFRVEVRKLRTLLKAGRPLYGRFHADAVRAGFTEMHRATSTLRDEEVFLELLRTLDVSGSAFEEFVERRSARERSIRRAVVALVRSPKMKRARLLLEALATLPVRPAKERNLHKFSRKTVASAQSEVEALRTADPKDSVRLHNLRIAWKELRYACELLDQGLPPDVRALAEPAAKMQKRLGEIHDVDAALSAVSRARAMSPLLRAQLTQGLMLRRDRLVDKYVELANQHAENARVLAASVETQEPDELASRREIRPSAASGS
jgi:CHAD domain-containing protein